jgi:GTP-binding protein Era
VSERGEPGIPASSERGPSGPAPEAPRAEEVSERGEPGIPASSERGPSGPAPEAPRAEEVSEQAFRSGFVSLVGRPNVGKSTLVNRLVGAKVAIVSDRPQTTRTQIRGVRTTPTTQMVLLDTPGIHKPRTLLGERTNARAVETLAEVDVVCFLAEATARSGRGDRFVAGLVHSVETPSVFVLSKTDLVDRATIARRLGEAGELGEFDAYVPLSALTGDGVAELAGELETRLPEGPEYYPGGVVTDQPETFLAAELLREQLLRFAREELPHSITVVVEETEDPQPVGRAGDDPVLRLAARVLVERESQKGMVIGRGGSVIKEAGTAARMELETLLGVRVHLETRVQVERDWQRRAQLLDRLGF